MQTNNNANKPNDNVSKNPQPGSTIKDAPPQTEKAMQEPKDGQIQAPGQNASNDGKNVDKQATIGQSHDKAKTDGNNKSDGQAKSQDNAK
jgi:hypothetical protein